MKAYGLTGNIGCGKSTVARLLATHAKVTVIHSDDVAKEIIMNGEHREKINAIIGENAFPGGVCDTRIIARNIFSDNKKRKSFEALIHPLAWSRITDIVDARPAGHLAIVESAIIFETSIQDAFRGVIVAHCSDAIATSRLKMYRNMSDEDIDARRRHQLPTLGKIARASHVINTECDEDKLAMRVQFLYEGLTRNQRKVS